MKKKDTQSRKWQITINNPLSKNFTHYKIKEEISRIKSCIYYCLSDEIGNKEKTHHTHIYIVCSSGIRFSTIKNRFPEAHIELAKGTSEQNRDYVFKLGKYEKEKGTTKLPDTQEECGEMPLERQGARNDLADLFDLLKNGKTDFEILEENPSYIPLINSLDKIRQSIQESKYREVFREVTTTYIYGKTGTGKTRGIIDTYGVINVFRLTDYSRGCFDGYKGQDVIMFEEFNSSFKIQLMLNYLDIYPLELPCRYNNKTACYTKVFIISNMPLYLQYQDIQSQYPETWNAFLRRIDKVIEYYDNKKFNEYTVKEYVDMYTNNN